MLELRIVRLQVQRSPLKPGTAPLREYRPSSIIPVCRLEVSGHGSVGVTAGGERIVDVHNTSHPQTRDRKGRAGVSVMATGDYEALRSRYGEHVADGIAGESVLVDFPAGLAGRSMPTELTIRTSAGDVLLRGVHIAKPCVEFARFCLRKLVSADVDDAVQRGLVDLDGGSRGYKAVADSEGTVHLGDTLLIDESVEAAQP